MQETGAGGRTFPSMKKTIAIAVALAVVLVPSAASAGKKKLKPYKSDTVSIAMGHPVLNSASGSVVSVTGQEFIARCDLPATNGLDGYVFEIPKPYQKVNATIEAIGSTPSPEYDVDIYTFDSDCNLVQALNAPGYDESGAIMKGTAFVFVHNYLPGPLDVYITLKAL